MKILNLYAFQFQNGTIKRLERLGDVRTLSKFQFQNGTIKRKQTYPLTWIIPHFNSKMVRLRVGTVKELWSADDISIPKWYD